MRDTLLLSDQQFHEVAWTKRFWSDYFWMTPCAEGEYQELAFQPLEFAITDSLAITLHFDAQLSNVTLGMKHPQFESIQSLGWDNRSHWQPYALRWDELETLCRCFVERGSAPEADMPLLLLYRFAPLTRADNVDAAISRIDRAWRRLGVFSNREIDHLSSFADRGDADMQWYVDSQFNWQLRGYSAYSLRTEDNTDFPHQQLESLLALAKSLVSSE